MSSRTGSRAAAQPASTMLPNDCSAMSGTLTASGARWRVREGTRRAAACRGETGHSGACTGPSMYDEAPGGMCRRAPPYRRCSRETCSCCRKPALPEFAYTRIAAGRSLDALLARLTLALTLALTAALLAGLALTLALTLVLTLALTLVLALALTLVLVGVALLTV